MNRGTALVLITAICLWVGGFFHGSIYTDMQIPRNLSEIMSELIECQEDTRESCSIVIMPDSSERELQLLYSQHVK